jgi:ATP-dependent Clp protease ATP-binding subunit ClpA
MLTRFRAECTSLYSMSLAEAKRLQHAYVGVEHVALALLRDPVYPLTATLQQTGLDAATLMREFEKEVGTGKSPSATTDATPRLATILALGAVEGELTARAILRSILLEGESLFIRFLVAQGVTTQKLLSALTGGEPNDSSADATRFSGGSVAPASAAPAKPASPNTPSSFSANAGTKIEPKFAIPVTFPTPTLDKWGRDLRSLAEQGRLSDAIGREREIEQMIMILARTQKANPILLGD